MVRPAKFTAAAMIVFIGSGIVLLASVIALVRPIPGESRTHSIPFIVTGVWGVATAIGIFCRWRWARISVLIFSGLTAYAAAAVAPVLAFIRTPVHTGDLPVTEPRLPQFFVGIALFAVGMCWVAWFSGKRSKEYFRARARAHPTHLSIAVVAWYLVAAGTFGFVSLFWQVRNHSPAIHFGFVFTGWWAFAANFFYSAIALYPGIALLRHRRNSLRFATGYSVFLLLDVVVFLARPDRNARVLEYISAQAASVATSSSHFSATSLAHLLQLASVEWGILTLLALWFLVTHRKTVAVPEESPRGNLDPPGYDS